MDNNLFLITENLQSIIIFFWSKDAPFFSSLIRSTRSNGLFCFPVVVPGFQPLLFSGCGSGFSAPFLEVGVLHFASLILWELRTSGIPPHY